MEYERGGPARRGLSLSRAVLTETCNISQQIRVEATFGPIEVKTVNKYDASSYGERIADAYYDRHRSLDSDCMVPVLAELAHGGRVLE